MGDNHSRDDYARAYWRENAPRYYMVSGAWVFDSRPKELSVASAESIRSSEHPTKKGLHVIRRLFPELE